MDREMDKYSVALDIGASKVALLVGAHRSGGMIDIVADVIVPIEEGTILRGEITNVNAITSAIRRALNTLERDYKIRIDSATMGISGRHIVVEDIRENVNTKYYDEVTQSDIDTLQDAVWQIKPRNEHFIIDILSHEFDTDAKKRIKNPLGMESSKLYGNFTILYGPNTLRDQMNKVVERVGLDLAEMVPFAMASAEAVLSADDKELGVCLVDLGTTTTEIAIYQDSKLCYIKTLPFGVSLLNNDLKAWGVLQRFAESIKVQFGEALPEYTPVDVMIEIPVHHSVKNKHIPLRTISKIIESRMSEIIRAIKDIINEAGYDIQAGIVLTGGGAKLKNVDRLFKNRSGFLTRIGIPSERVYSDDNNIVFDTRYSTAIGVLLKAYGMNSFANVEFLTDSEEAAIEQPTEDKVRARERRERRARNRDTGGIDSRRGLFSRRKEQEFEFGYYEDEEIEEFDEEYTEEDEEREGGNEDTPKGPSMADKFWGIMIDKLVKNE